MEKPVNHLVIAAFILVGTTAIVLSAAAKTDVQEPPTITALATSELQEATIRKNYLLRTKLRSNQLEVRVADGHATLAGRVDQTADSEMAEKIALAVEGIVTVDNRIVAASDDLPTQTYKPTRPGSPTDDSNISAAILAKLQWSDFRKALEVQVSTEAGKVTLEGIAETLEAKLFAGSTADSTAGVVEVNNLLNVKNTPPTAVSQLWQRMEKSRRAVVDGWMTTKVKAQLLYSGLNSRSDIAVSTRDQNHAQVIELAQDTPGVGTVPSSELPR